MIEVENLHKSFDGSPVLRGLDVRVDDGELLALIGGSGIGKSVFLKHVVGLMKPDKGKVVINGLDIHRLRGKRLEEMRKQFGFLFQGGALFDSLTVLDNVAFPLREKTSLKEARIKDRVFEELGHMGLKEDWKKYPAELSGGMKKRVSLARALIMEPSIMLFDEPTTGLDPIIGQTILHYIASCHKRLGFSGIIVSHDIPEIFGVVQKVAMIHEGAIVACGSPDEIQRHDDPIVQQFIRGETEGPVKYG
jgi:phospholipid/cholesterol/gamma-HCH transport system ATP-binding protein